MAKSDNTALLIAGAVAAAGYYFRDQITAWFATVQPAVAVAAPVDDTDAPVTDPGNTAYAAQQATAAVLAVSGGSTTPAQQAITAGQTAAAVVAQQGGTPVQQQAASSLAAAQTAATVVTQQGGTPAAAAVAGQIAANAPPPPPVVQAIPQAIAAQLQPVVSNQFATVPAGGIPFAYLVAAAAAATGQNPTKQVAAYQAELQGLPRRRSTRRFYDRVNRAV